MSKHDSAFLGSGFKALPKKFVVLSGCIVFIFSINAANAEFNVHEVSATEAAELLKENPEIKILDVRTGFEYRAGHLQGAENINYYSFRFKTNLDKLDKNATWLVHCHSGVRSGKTLPLMKAAGFTNVIHLTNGMVEWKDAGLPVVE